MRKWLRIALVFLLVAGLGACWWFGLRSGEPVYEGKTLSFWANQYGSNHWKKPGGELDRQAEAAVRHFGANAIPVLVQIMSLKESPLKLRCIQLADRLPRIWQGRFNLPTLNDYRNALFRRRMVGAFGVVALGADAKPAIPALIALLNDKDKGTRIMAVFTLGRLGAVAKDALPALINCCRKDPVSGVRLDAVISLGVIHEEPERVIPILIGLLDNKDWAMREGAIVALLQYGTRAKPAVPKLVGLLHDADYAVRADATNALRAIDPDDPEHARWK